MLTRVFRFVRRDMGNGELDFLVAYRLTLRFGKRARTAGCQQDAGTNQEKPLFRLLLLNRGLLKAEPRWVDRPLGFLAIEA